MKKTLSFIFIMLVVSPAFGDEIGRRSCVKANPNTLHGGDKIAALKFINSTRPYDAGGNILPIELGAFGWTNTGSGKPDFLALFDFSERGFFNRLWIYRCESDQSLKIQ